MRSTLEKLEIVYGLSKAAREVLEDASEISVHRVPADVFIEFVEKHNISYYTQKGNDATDEHYYVANSADICLFSQYLEKDKEITELTLDDVAELKGIPVEKLRIKE